MPAWQIFPAEQSVDTEHEYPSCTLQMPLMIIVVGVQSGSTGWPFEFTAHTVLSPWIASQVYCAGHSASDVQLRLVGLGIGEGVGGGVEVEVGFCVGVEVDDGTGSDVGVRLLTTKYPAIPMSTKTPISTAIVASPFWFIPQLLQSHDTGSSSFLIMSIIG